MPGWLRSQLMEQPPAATVQELCSLARKQMTIREMCRNEHYPEDGFNEISETVSQNLISALTKLSTTQEQMEKQLNEVRTQMSEQKKTSHGTSPASQNYRNMHNQQHNATPNTPLQIGQFEGGYQKNFHSNRNTLFGQARGNRGGQRQNNWQPRFTGGYDYQRFPPRNPNFNQRFPPKFQSQQYPQM